MLRLIIRKTRTGQYPESDRLYFRRYAWLGIVVMYWGKRARQEGLYKEFFQLAASGWLPVLCTVLDKLMGTRGRRVPTETMAFERPLREWGSAETPSVVGQEAAATLLEE
jgi:hypothetical protein